MSYNNPFRNQRNDTDSRGFLGESNMYRSGKRDTPSLHTSSADPSVFQPTKELSFLHSCGLDSEDLQTLAKLPEHLITTDNLPNILLEIKKNKIIDMTSSARPWDGRSHGTSVDCLPSHQPYSHNREAVESWANRWGGEPQTNSSPSSNYVVEYNHLKETSSYGTDSSRHTPSSTPFSSYSRDSSHSSHSSARDVDARSQSSRFSNRDTSNNSLFSSRGGSSSSYPSSRYASQSSQHSSRDSVQSSRMSSREDRIVSMYFRNVNQTSVAPLGGTSLPSILSLRGLAASSRPYSKDFGQSSRRKDANNVPTKKEASDFHGRAPPAFPYACALCDITVLSNRDWNVHVTGPQHANSQLAIVEKFPGWDQKILSARRSGHSSETSTGETEKERERPSRSNNGSTSRSTAATSSKSASTKNTNQKKSEATSKCKVVNVKFDVDGVDEPYLRELLGNFGTIVKMIVFPRLALVEMGDAGQAEEVVKHFIQSPCMFKRHRLDITLSSAFTILQSSRVVSFTPIPTGEGISSELKAVAKRFGLVVNSMFLPKRGYVEMSEIEEANKLVEHYSTKSLKLKGKTITVAISLEYQTLRDMNPDKESSPVDSSSRRRSRGSPSPKRSRRQSHSPRRRSPSPRRRSSQDRSRSQRSHDSKKQDEKRDSKERTRKESSSVSKTKSSSKDKVKVEKEDSSQEKDKNDQMFKLEGPVDSDLEGVEVLAGFCDEWNTVDELDDEKEDEGFAMEVDDPKTIEQSKDLNEKILSSDMDTSNVMPESAPSVSTKEALDEDGNKKMLQPGDKNKECQQEEQSENLKTDDKNEEIELGEEKDELEKSKSEEGLKPGEPKELYGDEKENLVNEEKKDENLKIEEMLSSEYEEPATDTELMKEGTEKETSASSEGTFGRVLEVVGFPVAKKYGEEHLWEIGKQYGDVSACLLLRKRRKVEMALIEMVNAADASKLEAYSQNHKIKLGSKILRITISEKYAHLNEGKTVDSGKVAVDEVGERDPVPSCFLASGEEGIEVRTETQSSEEENNALMKTDMDLCSQTSEEEELVEVEKSSDAENVEFAPSVSEVTDAAQTQEKEKESSDDEKEESVPLSDAETIEAVDVLASEPDTQAPILDPAGTEFVRPVVGYYCSLCNAIYYSEQEAKDEHCRTPLHHQKLKEHTEGNGST